jgi:prepilin-type N-terminal cleavage/methylation domain-containing protein
MAQACRLRLIKSAPRRLRADAASSGYTLVEVMVAMLLTSIMVTSVFSVALTVKTGGNKGERKIKAAAGARQVAAMLKNYVTGDPNNTLIPGPGLGTNKWSMDSGGVDDTSCSNCYALTSGTHTLTGILPATFEAAPFNARVIYFVDPAGDTIT